MTNSKPFKILAAVLVANIVALLLILLGQWIGRYNGDVAGAYAYADFTIVPLLMGMICAFFWRKENFTAGQYALYSLLNTVVAIAFSWLFIGEGYICLIIVSPLLMGFNIVGAFIGREAFRRKNDKLNSSIIGILLVLFAVDTFSKHSYDNEVSDTITIHATAATVWKYVVAYEPNTEKNTYWLFRIGLPSPVQSTVEGYCLGARRKCIFSNGYTFDEVISVYEPGKNLTFDITSQPKDPEIMQHMDLLKGQFLLTDNGDGTTTVTGNSWYRLYVAPAWYYDLWASSIVRNVHLRVMEHIKTIAEAETNAGH